MVPDDYVEKVLRAITVDEKCENCNYASGNTCKPPSKKGSTVYRRLGCNICSDYEPDTPDCCSLTGELHWPNGGIERFEHSIDYDKWEKKDNVYLRYPNHLNTVKRELALQVGFKDMGHGEDKDYSDRLKPLLKTEAKIEGVIYHYMMR
jgi:hypothetical protein